MIKMIKMIKIIYIINNNNNNRKIYNNFNLNDTPIVMTYTICFKIII
jgi:hypothetical protein